MRPSSREHRVTLLAPITAKNGLGETRPSGWEEVITLWAKVVPVSDGERWRAGAVEQRADARITVAYSALTAAVDGTYRVFLDGATWQIIGSKPVGFRLGFELTAWRMPAA